MNVLVTLSVRLRRKGHLDFGPETGADLQQVQPLTGRIFYRNTEVQQLLDVMCNPATYMTPKSLTSLRQLTSGFRDLTSCEVYVIKL